MRDRMEYSTRIARASEEDLVIEDLAEKRFDLSLTSFTFVDLFISLLIRYIKRLELD
jgi:hypothetical protein